MTHSLIASICLPSYYLESLALGIERGLYDESIVKTYMQPIFEGTVSEYIGKGLIKTVSALDPVPGDDDATDDYCAAVALVAKWSYIPWYRRRPNVS